MRIEYMREFIAVAETGSFTGAAARLYVTQPVLSKHMKFLETEFGVKMLIRSSRGIELTEFGKRALETFRRIVADYDAFVVDAHHSANGISGVIRIGILHMAADRYVLPAVQEFQSSYPNIGFEFSAEKPQELKRDLLEGRLDIAFISESGYEGSGLLSYAPLGQDEIKLAVSKANQIASLSVVDAKDTEGCPLVCLKAQESTSFLNSMLFNAGFHPTRIIEVDELEIAAAMIVSENGYFAIPEFMCRMFYGYPDITIASMSNRLSVQVAFAFRASGLSEAAKLFLDKASDSPAIG